MTGVSVLLALAGAAVLTMANMIFIWLFLRAVSRD
jgi:hypothetical protein